jgi:curli biogenesis system outer membrane secretion channel CsgG
VLLVQGEITRLTEGSQALRYFVGFGAGAAKTQIETRVVDVSTGQVQLVTADRRAAGMGIFGGDGRQFVTESLDQITDGFVKLLRHLAAGGRPGPR